MAGIQPAVREQLTKNQRSINKTECRKERTAAVFAKAETTAVSLAFTGKRNSPRIKERTEAGERLNDNI